MLPYVFHRVEATQKQETITEIWSSHQYISAVEYENKNWICLEDVHVKLLPVYKITRKLLLLMFIVYIIRK